MLYSLLLNTLDVVGRWVGKCKLKYSPPVKGYYVRGCSNHVIRPTMDPCQETKSRLNILKIEFRETRDPKLTVRSKKQVTRNTRRCK